MDRTGADGETRPEPVTRGPRPRASLLATLGLIVGVAGALFVLTGTLPGTASRSVCSARCCRVRPAATRRRHVAGKTDALSACFGLAAVVLGVLAMTGQFDWPTTDGDWVQRLREWLDSQFVDRFWRAVVAGDPRTGGSPASPTIRWFTSRAHLFQGRRFAAPEMCPTHPTPPPPAILHFGPRYARCAPFARAATARSARGGWGQRGGWGGGGGGRGPGGVGEGARNESPGGACSYAMIGRSTQLSAVDPRRRAAYG